MLDEIREAAHREQSAVGVAWRRQRRREEKGFGERDFAKDGELQKAAVLRE